MNICRGFVVAQLIVQRIYNKSKRWNMDLTSLRTMLVVLFLSIFRKPLSLNSTVSICCRTYCMLWIIEKKSKYYSCRVKTLLHFGDV